MATITEILQSYGNAASDELLKSPSFAPILAAVEDRARTGVTIEAKKNAIPLLALALAGGGAGGIVFKGTGGMIMGGLLAWWAFNKISTPASSGPMPISPPR
jgi:hypothetical protein